MWLSRDERKTFMGGKDIWYNISERKPEFSKFGHVKNCFLSLCEDAFEEETGIEFAAGEYRKIKKISFELEEE